eukprot:scaffold183730_cov31-Tisochrysis_lutea.AAC.3
MGMAPPSLPLRSSSKRVFWSVSPEVIIARGSGLPPACDGAAASSGQNCRWAWQDTLRTGAWRLGWIRTAGDSKLTPGHGFRSQPYTRGPQMGGIQKSACVSSRLKSTPAALGWP